MGRTKKDIYLIKILKVFDFVVCYTKSPFKTLIFKVIQRQLNIFKELNLDLFPPPPKFGALSSPGCQDICISFKLQLFVLPFTSHTYPFDPFTKDTQCALVSLIELGINTFCQL